MTRRTSSVSGSLTKARSSHRETCCSTNGLSLMKGRTSTPGFPLSSWTTSSPKSQFRKRWHTMSPSLKRTTRTRLSQTATTQIEKAPRRQTQTQPALQHLATRRTSSWQKLLRMPSLPLHQPIPKTQSSTCISHGLETCVFHDLKTCISHGLEKCIFHDLKTCISHGLETCIFHDLKTCISHGLETCIFH